MIVPLEELANVWPEVCPWLEKAIARGQGDENVLDVFIALARGIYELWYEPKCFAAVVHVVKYPRQAVATIVYCGGGDLCAIEHTFEFGKKEAKRRGVQILRCHGREGWERLLDMKRIGVILQLEVT